MDPVLELLEPDDVGGRLDAEAHLVAVVLTLDVEAVQLRADEDAQELPALRDLLSGHGVFFFG